MKRRSSMAQWLALALGLSPFAVGCGSDAAGGEMPPGTDAGLVEDVEFLDLRVEELTDVRAVVRFDTSLPTSCEVEWGLTADALVNTATDPSMEEGEVAIEHEVPLEDLSPDTMYFWRAKGTDVDERTFYSDVLSFRTPMGTTMPTGENVATMTMGTSVVDVSSNFAGMANANTWGANNTIDGSMSTEWSSDGDGDDAWVTLDFGVMRDVQSFGFRSRKMLDGTSIVTSVRLIFDGDTTMGPFATPDPDLRYEFPLTPIRARQVRVEVVTSTGGNTGAKAIQFFTP